jgi:hypothetical protein
MPPIDDLKKVRLMLVELRRREAGKIADGSGEIPTYAPALFNTMNWIGAVDRAIEDEKKAASRDAPALTTRSAASRRRPA